jgi:phage-related protein (TIGR01555 family)
MNSNQQQPIKRLRAISGSVPAIDAETKRTMDAFLSAMLVQDAFSNPAARTGFGTNNLLEATSYPLTRLSRNYILLQSLYRSNWIARKIVDAMAEDMMKNWVRFDLDADPKKIKLLENDIRDTGTEAQLLNAIRWGRLFGGAAAVIMIKGDGKKLDTPLKVESVGIGEYRGLLVFDRWSGITPGARTSYDLDDPLNFDLPETYRITTQGGGSYEVHASRVLRFCGRGLPHWEWEAEQKWGISEFEVIYDELKKRDNTSANIASLIFRANILAMRQKDLNSMLSGLGANAQAQQRFYQTLKTQTELMSNQGLMILPEEGGMEQHSYSFSGIAEVYHEFMLDICGAAEYPMSRLFGRSSSGLAGTNEGDEHAYYDTIGQKQKRDLGPVLHRLFPIIAMSTWGKVPSDFDWSYNPVRTMSSEAQAELAGKKGTTIVEFFNAGIISQKTAMQEGRALTDETGMFSNITDEDVEAADDEAQGAGEDLSSLLGASEGEEENSLKSLPGAKEKGLKLPEKKGGEKSVEKGKKEIRSAAKKGSAKDEATAAERPEPQTITFAGFPIVVENPTGSVRSGAGWAVTMTCPYGYFASTVGADGDGVDVFLGPDETARNAYVVHTQNPATSEYDEDKVMLGFSSAAEASAAFLENYSQHDFFQSMESVPVDKLHGKLATCRGRKLKIYDGVRR